ncbi:MAG TPA: MerR family transcriptional regulator [Chloroflexota bacterium]|nr:MerR family transcriptional regulator [Chloroflexota bacterium]
MERGTGYLQIGEAASRTSLTQRTLRYYEELGLFRPASRMEGGFRLYSPDDVERIDYIKNLRDVLGFSLAEIKEMLAAEDTRAQIKRELHQTGGLSREERRNQLLKLKEVAVGQMRIVNEKRARLKDMRHGIQDRIERIDTLLAELGEMAGATS